MIEMQLHLQIQEVLKEFDPISLKEMDSVELMNRTDSKYIFNFSLLPEILNDSKSHYKILEIKQERLFSYVTTYYDTSNYTLFNNHLTGKLNRHKIRHRTYESTGVSYLEVKFKSNKNRTIKWRIKHEISNGFDKNASDFLLDRTKMISSSLNPVITNCFKRITLVSIKDKTRITLDFNISFKGGGGLEKELPFLAIAEIKQEGHCNNNMFVKLLRKRGIRQEGFSKYCVGSALLYNIPRKNLLKPKFLYLNRIKNDYDKHATSY
jgi:hypothetical protein